MYKPCASGACVFFFLSNFEKHLLDAGEITV